jgi:STE24 endopeptidase
MEDIVLISVFGLLTINIGFRLFLSILNYKHRNKAIPEELKDVYDEEKYNNWKNYYLENFKLSLIDNLLDFFVLVLLLATGIFKTFNNWAVNLTDNLAFQALIMIGFYFIITYTIGLYFSYYTVFKIEEKYGFNKMTKKLFVIDKIKGLLFTIILGGGAIYGIVALFLSAGDLFFIIAWSSITIIMIFINLSYTKLIVPIFNKLRPLEDSSLKTKIFAFAESVGYEISKISVIDASKRSTKLNAYFSGFGKTKRIVLYDTLIEKSTEEEIVAVLAHEIGHNKHKHIIFNLLQTVIMISIYILGLMVFLKQEIFSLAFGFTQISYGFNILIYLVLLSPILMVINLLLSYISRKFEYQADHFAAINYSEEHLISALKVLHRENFSNLTPHPLYVKFYYSHPPLYERIFNIKNNKKDKS